MLSTRGDRVPWRPFKTLPGPASFVHIAPFKCQAKVPSLLANCTTCTEYYNLLANNLRGLLSKWLFAWIGFLFSLLFVQFPPNDAIISNGQWKIRAHTERRGSPPPQRSNTANVIYVMHIVPTTQHNCQTTNKLDILSNDNFNLNWKLNFHVKQDENPLSTLYCWRCSKWNFDLVELQGSLL